MRKKPKQDSPQYKRNVLVVVANHLDDILEYKDDLPPLAVSYLYRVRRVITWHIKHATRPKNGLDPDEKAPESP